MRRLKEKTTKHSRLRAFHFAFSFFFWTKTFKQKINNGAGGVRRWAVQIHQFSLVRQGWGGKYAKQIFVGLSHFAFCCLSFSIFSENLQETFFACFCYTLKKKRFWTGAKGTGEIFQTSLNGMFSSPPSICGLQFVSIICSFDCISIFGPVELHFYPSCMRCTTDGSNCSKNDPRMVQNGLILA